MFESDYYKKTAIILLLLFLIVINFNYLSAAERIKLTPEEKEWIDAHPQVDVAMMKKFPPFSYVTEDDELRGFSVDLLKLLGQKTGLEFRFEVGLWSENLAKFKADTVDAIDGISYKKERLNYTLYTQPYYRIPMVVYLRQEDNWYQKPQDLSDKEVGVLKDAYYKDVLKEEVNPQIIEEADNEKLFKDLAFGRFDAVVSNLSIGEFYIQKNVLTNLKLAGEYSSPQLEKEDLRLGVQKDNAMLQNVLKKALQAVSETEWMELKNKWLSSKEETKLDDLTAAEESYLNNKEEISLCVNPDWMPFEKINEQGEYEGTVAQFYDLLSQKLGVEIKTKQSNSWQQSVKKLKNKKCDIVSTAIKRRDEGLEFTQPYIKYPLVIATRQEELYISSLDAVKDKKIGLSQDCPLAEIIKNSYPNNNFVKVQNTKRGLEQVQNKELFGFVNTAPSIGYVIQRENMFDVKISGELATELALRIGVNPENKMLLSILEKTLRSIESDEKEEIFNNWLTIKYEDGFNYKLFIRIMLGIALVGLFLLYRQYQLKQFNQRLSSVNKELAQANQKLEDISYLDGLTQISNRRKFDEVLEKEWKHCKREQLELSLIMLDLDYFKEFNDRYGHLAGDDCLKEIAETIEEYVNRPRDLAARYGGEEFMVILPETDLKGARQVAEKIQQAIIDLEIEHEASKVAPYVTVSLGVSTIIPKDEAGKEKFLDTVDKALYQAKETGRNQIKVKDLR